MHATRVNSEHVKYLSNASPQLAFVRHMLFLTLRVDILAQSPEQTLTTSQLVKAHLLRQKHFQAAFCVMELQSEHVKTNACDLLQRGKAKKQEICTLLEQFTFMYSLHNRFQDCKRVGKVRRDLPDHAYTHAQVTLTMTVV